MDGQADRSCSGPWRCDRGRLCHAAREPRRHPRFSARQPHRGGRTLPGRRPQAAARTATGCRGHIFGSKVRPAHGHGQSPAEDAGCLARAAVPSSRPPDTHARGSAPAQARRLLPGEDRWRVVRGGEPLHEDLHRSRQCRPARRNPRSHPAGAGQEPQGQRLWRALPEGAGAVRKRRLPASCTHRQGRDEKAADCRNHQGFPAPSPCRARSVPRRTAARHAHVTRRFPTGSPQSRSPAQEACQASCICAGPHPASAAAAPAATSYRRYPRWAARAFGAMY
jgi:hypothetical protein